MVLLSVGASRFVLQVNLQIYSPAGKDHPCVRVLYDLCTDLVHMWNRPSPFQFPKPVHGQELEPTCSVTEVLCDRDTLWACLRGLWSIPPVT